MEQAEEQSEEQLLDAIFKSSTKEKTSERIQISNSSDVVITILPHDHKKDRPMTEEEYDEHFYQMHTKAAKGIFDALFDESCIKFWTELTKLIKKHCADSDTDNERCLNMKYPPEGHFRKMFNEAAKDTYGTESKSNDEMHVE
jgi:hypothetical protein